MNILLGEIRISLNDLDAGLKGSLNITDAMEALFVALAGEEHPGVRAVLGHFVFVFIHPYQDGNGRLGRFLMNAMLASGGYPWTVIRVTQRAEYMAALEEASTRGGIAAFTRFVAQEMKVDWRSI